VGKRKGDGCYNLFSDSKSIESAFYLIPVDPEHLRQKDGGSSLIDKLYEKVLGNLAVTLCASLVGLMFVMVIQRYFFHHALSWSNEMVKLLHVWLIFVAASIGVKRGAHISIKFLETRLHHPRAKKALVSLDNILLLAAVILMAVMSSKVVWMVLELKQVTICLRWPYAIWYLALPVCFALMAIPLVIYFLSKGKNSKWI